MNNDELQKAIDDITKETAAPTENVAAEAEALANEIAGVTVPSGAPTTGEGVALNPTGAAEAAAPAIEIPAAPAPEVPEAPAMPPKAAAPAPEAQPSVAAPVEVPAAPVAEKPKMEVPEVPAMEPEPAASEVTGEMADIKKEALKELYPLLDKTDMTAEEKYEICMEMQSEPDAMRRALDYAKKFEDTDKKVEALLTIYRM